jgi:hypothetical protein
MMIWPYRHLDGLAHAKPFIDTFPPTTTAVVAATETCWQDIAPLVTDHLDPPLLEFRRVVYVPIDLMLDRSPLFLARDDICCESRGPGVLKMLRSGRLWDRRRVMRHNEYPSIGVINNSSIQFPFEPREV